MSRERSAHLIPVNEDTVGSQKGSQFVNRLHLITDEDNTVDGAIKDFIRCNIEKARLSREETSRIKIGSALKIHYSKPVAENQN